MTVMPPALWQQRAADGKPLAVIMVASGSPPFLCLLFLSDAAPSVQPNLSGFRFCSYLLASLAGGGCEPVGHQDSWLREGHGHVALAIVRVGGARGQDRTGGCPSPLYLLIFMHLKSARCSYKGLTF